MALIAGAVGNEGVMPTPQLIKQVTGLGGLPGCAPPAARTAGS